MTRRLASATQRRMGTSLRARLYAGFLLVAFAGLAVGGILVDRNVRQTAHVQVVDRLSYEATMLGQMTASALFGDIDPTDTSLNDSVHALSDAVHTRLAVIAKNGAVVADSASTAPLAEPAQLDAPEVAEAREKGTGTSTRDGQVFVAHTIMSDGQPIGFARASVSADVVSAAAHAVRVRMLYGAAFAILVALLLSYVVSSRISRPIQALAEGARRLGEGDFDHTIAVTTRDELGELSRTFNDMRDNLRETIARLDDRNRDMRRVLDNVDQGLLTVDRNATISAEHSAIIEDWFGPVSPGTLFSDYLSRVDKTAGATFACAWEMLLEDAMPFDVSLEQLPRRAAAAGRAYELEYTPIGTADTKEAFGSMLIVISDVTPRIAAERAQAEQRELVAAFERITKDRAAFVEFFAEAQAMIDQTCSDTRPPLPTVKRLLHTLKGNLALFGLHRFEMHCHQLEDRVAESGADLTPVQREELSAQWREFATRLQALLGERAERTLQVDDQELAVLLRSVLDGAPRSDIAQRLSSWRLERIEARFQRFATQARTLAARLHKPNLEVSVETNGLRLSREVLSRFWAAFTHVVRNAVDHGVESSEERAKAGKAQVARIALRAERAGEDVVLEVEDDGRGIDWDAVARKAKEAGLPHASRADLVDALLSDGFSTRPEAGSVSGRGVGLASVRIECERLGGRLAVRSEPSRGTSFRFILPSSSSTSPGPGGPSRKAAAPSRISPEGA